MEQDKNIQGELVWYQPDNNINIEVRVEDETVWLTQAQMALLFDKTPQNVTMHIRNIYKEEELFKESTCKDFLQVQNEGDRTIKRYAKFYNLDVIISVGYRVKSKMGTKFRQWALQIIKDSLLKRNAVNQRLDRLEVKVYKLEEKTNNIETEVKGQLPPHEGLFYDGQIFDSYSFISDLVRKAKIEIILIDNYIDDSVLKILDKRGKNVFATIYTAHYSEKLQLDLAKHNSQYSPINIKTLKKFHDRFLIIDDDVYHIGASIKDLGKSVFAFSKMGLEKKNILSIL